MINAALLLSSEALNLAYGDGVLTRLRHHAQIDSIVAPAHEWPSHRLALGGVEAIFSGWGAPVMDEELLRAMPDLKVIFYAGGCVRHFLTEGVLRLGGR